MNGFAKRVAYEEIVPNQVYILAVDGKIVAITEGRQVKKHLVRGLAGIQAFHYFGHEKVGDECHERVEISEGGGAGGSG